VRCRQFISSFVEAPCRNEILVGPCANIHKKPLSAARVRILCAAPGKDETGNRLTVMSWSIPEVILAVGY
jgi:hypothetical protein